MKTIGITGRSGCGKSTVTERFIQHGIAVVDADQIARDVLAPGSDCIPKLQAVFGNDICKGKMLDRRELANRAFSTPEGTEALNSITHPEIIRRICLAKQQAKASGASLFAIDGAVIFDTPCEQECDVFVVVTAPYEQSVSRIVARDGIELAMARRRLDAQMPTEQLVARADYLIVNNDTLQALMQNTDDTIAKLMEKSQC